MKPLWVDLSVCQHLPTRINLKLRCEIKYNIFRRKEKLFLLHKINIVLFLFKSTCYIYLFSFVSFLTHTVE